MNINYPPNKKYLKSPLNLVDGASDYISFEDKNVLRLMDRENLSYVKAQELYSLSYQFVNSPLVTFDEFQFFTGIKALTGPNVFTDSKDLESIVIPASVVSVGSDAFKGCTSLKEVIFLGPTTFDEDAFKDSPDVHIVTTYMGIGYWALDETFKIY